MERFEIEQKVKNFLINDFEYDEATLTPDARLREDIGIDSLDFVDLIVIVDREFHFRIEPDDLKTIITLSDFISYIEQKTSNS